MGCSRVHWLAQPFARSIEIRVTYSKLSDIVLYAVHRNGHIDLENPNRYAVVATTPMTAKTRQVRGCRAGHMPEAHATNRYPIPRGSILRRCSIRLLDGCLKSNRAKRGEMRCLVS